MKKWYDDFEIITHTTNYGTDLIKEIILPNAKGGARRLLVIQRSGDQVEGLCQMLESALYELTSKANTPHIIIKKEKK